MSMLDDQEIERNDTRDAPTSTRLHKASRSRRSVGRVFVWSVGFVIVFVLWAALSPDSLATIMASAMNSVSSGIGWIYLVVPFDVIDMLVCFESSRFGRIRIGPELSLHEYSTTSWLTTSITSIIIRA